MNTFRLFWDLHKWVGISAAVLVLITAVTGFLLLVKKEFSWIQPPTQAGAEGTIESFITLERAWQSVAALGHPDFGSLDDLDRIDVRPDKRVYKLRSRHNDSEVQVDAVTGAVLARGERVSDWLERIHDGSWIGEPFHDYVMPVFAFCLVFLVFSGMWLWLEPIVKRRRRRRRDAARSREGASG